MLSRNCHIWRFVSASIALILQDSHEMRLASYSYHDLLAVSRLPMQTQNAKYVKICLFLITYLPGIYMYFQFDADTKRNTLWLTILTVLLVYLEAKHNSGIKTIHVHP